LIDVVAVGAEPARSIQDDRAFLGHPRGLGYLAFTEGWISFSFYGMQSLLVLYMVGQLLKPGHLEHVLGFGVFHAVLERFYGHLDGQPLAAAIMGLYAATVYATPIFGGLIADRLLGRTTTIIIGSVLMTAGHFLMAFDASFLIALTCLIAGTGFAGTMKAQVGGLYPRGDLRRADAFQVYLLAVNIAVIISPLVCGTLGEKYAWHLGFGAAGVGMLIGLIVYLSGRRWLPADPIMRGPDKSAKAAPLTLKEWRIVGILLLLLPVMSMGAVGNAEIFNAYLVWGKENFQLDFFGQTMPVSWLLSLDAFISVATLFGSLMFWRWWAARRREPDEIVKVVIGLFISAGGPLVLAAAAMQAQGGHKVGLAWGLAFHIVNDIGFANVFAVGLALFSRAAPPALGATVVNAYSLHLFACNLFVGWLAGFLSRMPAVQFWLLHAALVAGAGAIMAVMAILFHKTLAPEAPADPDAARPAGAPT
jgi:proton-dependent oligopeptide transporter, POT family